MITDPQVLFDEITQLIVKTFDDLQIPQNVYNEFKNLGIFPLSILNKIVRDDNLLTTSRFIALMEHLHVIVRLPDEEKAKYFMPSILARAKPMSTESTQGSSSVCSSFMQLPPLLITFKCGYSPLGLFSSLIVYLLAKKAKSILRWKLKKNNIFSNAILFQLTPDDDVKLVLTSTYLEIDMYSSVERTTISVSKVCVEVRRCVEEAVQKVTSALHYTDDAKHRLAFYCTGCSGAGLELHAARVDFWEGKPRKVECHQRRSERGVQRFCLPSGYQHWFDEVNKIVFYV